MTEPLNPDYCVNCQKCGKPFEMVWGTDNQVCEECSNFFQKQLRNLIPEQIQTQVRIYFQNGDLIFIADDGTHRNASKACLVQDFYSNPDNWRRFPMDVGSDANGSPVEQYMWIGDGGEFARQADQI